MRKVLSLLVIVIGISLISITGSGCNSRNQNQANDSVVSESPTDESSTDELSQFREKFTIENVLNLVANPQSKSAAQKCGLEFIYKDSLKEEGYEEGQYFTYYQYAYGYDINKGKKKDNYMGYDLKSVSEHACYFIYSEGQDTDYRFYFKSKADADYLIDVAKENGFKKGEYDYGNGKYEMRSPESEDGWYKIYVSPSLSSYEVSEEKSEISSSSEEPYSNERLIFSNEQYIIGHLLNQRFRHSSGLEIRFDGDGRMYIDGDAAGVISVLRYDSESAILRYGNGMYGEGKLFMQYANGKIQLTDTSDGSVFYQK